MTSTGFLLLVAETVTTSSTSLLTHVLARAQGAATGWSTWAWVTYVRPSSGRTGDDTASQKIYNIVHRLAVVVDAEIASASVYAR